MTREERIKKLRCFIICMKCEMSGKRCDINCSIQYDAGNMGEIIENLESISKTLEQEPRKGKWIIDGHHRRCPECGEYFCIKDAEGNEIPNSFCPNCGAYMVEPQESEE